MDIHRLVTQYLDNGRPTGGDGVRADCPLCGSKRAFIISSSHGAWMCWSCRESGSFRRFLKDVAGLNTKQADRTLEETGTDVPYVSAKARKRRSISEGWVALPEYVLAAYEEIPEDLLEIGFGEELLRQHNVGLDTRNNRTVFPIRDILGRLVAISGRARSESQLPRYKVYDAQPETGSRSAGELFGVVPPFVVDNRRHLYGLDSVYPRKYHNPDDDSPIILTEGYKSTLWLRQLGYDSAVGLQGSSLSPSQLRFVTRLRGPYYVMLDNEPGKSYPDKKGYCAAIDILKALGKSGKALLCIYNEKQLGTAPDDLNVADVLEMIEGAKTVGQLTL